jgi:hypothetical protein
MRETDFEFGVLALDFCQRHLQAGKKPHRATMQVALDFADKDEPCRARTCDQSVVVRHCYLMFAITFRRNCRRKTRFLFRATMRQEVRSGKAICRSRRKNLCKSLLL